MTGRSLPADRYCDACEATFHARGSIGQCDHDFPDRPLRRFWCMVSIRADLGGLDPLAPAFMIDPRVTASIAVCRATTWAEARETLSPPTDRHQVSELVSWWLFATVDGLERGQRLELEVARPPSAYDEWKRGDGTTDFRAMEDAGKEVT